MILKTILLAVLIVGIAFAGIAIKMFFKKDGEFRKSCGSVDPTTGAKIGCSCGGGEARSESCKNKDE